MPTKIKKRIGGSESKMELIGIDIGFSTTRRTSGVARLSGSNLVCSRATSSWESRVEVLGNGPAYVAAIDGPILRDYSNHIRVCESVFARGLFSRRCKPGFSHVPGTGLRFRDAGEETAKQLTELIQGHDLSVKFPKVNKELNLVEAFPNAFLGVITPDDRFQAMPKLRRGMKFDWLYDQCCDTEAFQNVINTIGFEKVEDILNTIKTNRDHEKRAALVCILTAAAVAKGQYTAVGDDKGGYFFLPPWDLWAEWARKELDIQRKRAETVDVWINGKCFGASDNLN